MLLSNERSGSGSANSQTLEVLDSSDVSTGEDEYGGGDSGLVSIMAMTQAIATLKERSQYVLRPIPTPQAAAPIPIPNNNTNNTTLLSE